MAAFLLACRCANASANDHAQPPVPMLAAPDAESPNTLPTAPGSSQNRASALQLLQQYGETQAKLRSVRYLEQISSELQSQCADGPFASLNGSSRSYQRIEFCTDGTRARVSKQHWGNVKSSAIFIPETKAAYNSSLWDGNALYDYVATMDKPGRVAIYTGRPASFYLPRQKKIQEQTTPLWSRGTVRDIMRRATSLAVRNRREPVNQTPCFVLDAATIEAKYTLWLDPTRGYNIVRSSVVFRNFSGACTLENVQCQKIQQVWMPIQGEVRQTRTFRNGDYTKSVCHHKLSGLALNPDHQTLRSFAPNNVKNGASVHINPVLSQPINRFGVPVWQDGRVLDPQGHILFTPR